MAVPRQLLTPKWIVSHVVMAGLIVLAVVLGFWQLDRLDQKQAIGDTIEARIGQPAMPVEDIADGLTFDTGESIEYRQATATGTYDRSADIAVLNRTRNGVPGSWLLRHLVLESGDTVVVNLGWFPLGAQLDAAPSGPVEVMGLVRNTEVAQGLQNADPAEGVLTEVARVDLARLQQQTDAELLPVYLQLASQVPAPDPALQPLDPPARDDGPHFSYAVQWFTFALIGAVGYAIVLRRLSSGTRRSKADVPEWDTI